MVENTEYLSSRSEHSESLWESPVPESRTLFWWACPKNYVVILTPKSWNAMEILMTRCIFISKFNSTGIPCSYSGIQALFPALFLNCCIILDTSFPSVFHFLVYGMVSLTTFGWTLEFLGENCYRSNRCFSSAEWDPLLCVVWWMHVLLLTARHDGN